MTREFLKNLGLEDAAIDNILNENMADIGKEKAKTTAAKADLADAQGKLAAAHAELETLKKSKLCLMNFYPILSASGTLI